MGYISYLIFVFKLISEQKVRNSNVDGIKYSISNQNLQGHFRFYAEEIKLGERLSSYSNELSHPILKITNLFTILYFYEAFLKFQKKSSFSPDSSTESEMFLRQKCDAKKRLQFGQACHANANESQCVKSQQVSHRKGISTALQIRNKCFRKFWSVCK